MPVSIVLPYYNPAKNWSATIVDRFAQLKQKITEDIELIIVNDGTTFDIPATDIAHIKDHIPAAVFISYRQNRGKGYAIRQGVAKATGDLIIYTDVDFPYTIDSICKVYACLKSNMCDVAMGVKSHIYYKNVPPVRKAISKILRGMIKVFFTIPYTDTQCGLKGFKKEVKTIFEQTTIDRYLFDLEFIRNSYRAGMKIKAVQVILNEDVVFRRVNYRIILPEIMNLLNLMFK